jgi:DNA-directed RNA polymerase subunit F
MLLPMIMIVPPVDSATIWNDVFYIIIVVLGAIFATEYASWRLGHVAANKLKTFEKQIKEQVKVYEKKVMPFLDMVNKIDPKQIEGLVQNLSKLTNTVSNAIGAPKETPSIPELEKEVPELEKTEN